MSVGDHIKMRSLLRIGPRVSALSSLWNPNTTTCPKQNRIHLLTMTKRRFPRHIQQPPTAVDLTRTVSYLFIHIANQKPRTPLSERENDNIDPALVALGQSKAVFPSLSMLESNLKRVTWVLLACLIVESDRERKQYSSPFYFWFRFNRSRAYWKLTSFTSTTCFRRTCMAVETPLSNLAEALPHSFWSSHISDVFLSPEWRPHYARRVGQSHKRTSQKDGRSWGWTNSVKGYQSGIVMLRSRNDGR